MKQLGEGWNWRDLSVGDKFITYGRTIFEADLLKFVTLCGFSEELFTNREYIREHAPMRGGHPVPGALVYSMAEGLVIPTTLQGTGLAFLSMGFDIKGPTYVNDTLHVEIEVSPEFFSDRIGAMEELRRRIAHSIHNVTGLNVTVRLAEPHSLPRSEGKAKRVWDERQDSQ